jgi:hypothetical protein
MKGLDITIEEIAAVIGLVIAIIGLIYAGIQLSESKKIARGEFILHLDEMFQQHNDMQSLLRPAEKWGGDGNTGPATIKEWEDVEKYMGLFERINILVNYGIIDIETFEELYGYRIINIGKNKIIRKKKLVENASNWQNFIEIYNKTRTIYEKRLSQQIKHEIMDEQ